MTVPVSLLLGALVGLANAVAAVWMTRRALAQDPTRGMRMVLGGMVLRMAATLAVVVLVLAFADVHRGAFVAGLGALFVAGLLLEVALVNAAASSQPSADA